MDRRIALIAGIAGQDGSYLSEFLLNKGYEVHGLTKPFSEKAEVALPRIRHILGEINLHVGDVSEKATLSGLIRKVRPDEIYHLATRHEIDITVKEYLDTRNVETDSTIYFLAAIDEFHPDCKFFYASSSNVFGEVSSSPQSEKTSLNPNSIYSISKVAGMHLVQMYRNKKKIFACSGILFNHESPRRKEFFLTRKITSAAAKIKLGIETELALGDLDSTRDWGFSGDYVEAMWLILQAEKPQDYVIGTGKSHSVRDVLEVAFKYHGLEWRKYVKVSAALVRPKEQFELVADISKISKELGWVPKMKFHDLIQMMTQSDFHLYQRSR